MLCEFSGWFFMLLLFLYIFSPEQCLYLSLCLFKHLLGCSLGTKQQHSWNSGSGNAHIHTNTKEGSVCCGWWWRPSHESQEAAGRNVLRCHTWPRPESLYARGRFKLQTAGERKWHAKENTLKCLSFISGVLHSFHYTCSHHTSAPKAQLQNISTCTVQ